MERYTTRADFGESLEDGNLEDVFEHDCDDAVRWGEGEKAGVGSGGPWHSFECLGQQTREQDQEDLEGDGETRQWYLRTTALSAQWPR